MSFPNVLPIACELIYSRLDLFERAVQTKIPGGIKLACCLPFPEQIPRCLEIRKLAAAANAFA
jgi:hypothetical protein